MRYRRSHAAKVHLLYTVAAAMTCREEAPPPPLGQRGAAEGKEAQLSQSLFSMLGIELAAQPLQ